MDHQTPSPPSKPKEPSKQSKNTFIPPEDRKQSRFGIASFIISIITLLGYIIMASLGTTMIEPYVTPEGPILQPPQEALEAMTSLAAVFVIILAINLIGFLLGLAGSFSKNHKRSHSVIGAIINGIVLFIILILFVFVLNG
ncbi:hypothetical protein MNQ98_23040 [Paenibacillus sp. N3/727]|uniref:hypothetical protein n=1 Tax=Paenibacillus sp. N3/727 TaxID=2925845 RepID=UPI001F531D4E|nr:hypothetical protein [Paenibacillus sp. N3/727]UNK17327.1 hypothetical protein MNQ98_23040 [Paenibacillus sp. N3/727]